MARLLERCAACKADVMIDDETRTVMFTCNRQPAPCAIMEHLESLGMKFDKNGKWIKQ